MPSFSDPVGPAPADNAAADPPAKKAAPSREYRTWSDTTGQFKLEAMFLIRKGSDVMLRTRDGKVMTVPFDRLSPADQAFVEGD